MAKKPHEIDAIEATLREINAAATQFADHPSQEVPAGWRNRNGNRRIEGKLVELECLGAAVVFHVTTATEKLALYVENPRKVVLTNAPGNTVALTCGTFPPRDVAIEFVAKPSALNKTAGELTALEFK